MEELLGCFYVLSRVFFVAVVQVADGFYYVLAGVCWVEVFYQGEGLVDGVVLQTVDHHVQSGFWEKINQWR